MIVFSFQSSQSEPGSSALDTKSNVAEAAAEEKSQGREPAFPQHNGI